MVIVHGHGHSPWSMVKSMVMLRLWLNYNGYITIILNHYQAQHSNIGKSIKK